MAQKIPITQDNWNNNVPEDLHSVSEEIKEKVNIDADGYVIYPNNDRGSHITDHLKYHFKIPGAERPRDSLDFRALMSINVNNNSKNVKWLKWKT